MSLSCWYKYLLCFQALEFMDGQPSQLAKGHNSPRCSYCRTDVSTSLSNQQVQSPHIAWEMSFKTAKVSRLLSWDPLRSQGRVTCKLIKVYSSWLSAMTQRFTECEFTLPSRPRAIYTKVELPHVLLEASVLLEALLSGTQC